MRTAGYKRVQLLLRQDEWDGARNGSSSGDWGYEPDLRGIEHEEQRGLECLREDEAIAKMLRQRDTLIM